MPQITREDVRVPADVMPETVELYIDNYMAATRGTGRLMLFACDQKIEHLNKDFHGEGIDPADGDPISSRSATRAPSVSSPASAASSPSTRAIIPTSTTWSR